MISSLPISGSAYLAAYGTSLVLSGLIAWLTLRVLGGEDRLARFVRQRVVTDQRKLVCFGGIAVIVSFLATLWGTEYLFGFQTGQSAIFTTISLGVGLMFLLGIVDDLVNARPMTKLVWQVAIALFLYTKGFRIERIGDWWELGPLSMVLTTLWIVGISNSLNLIDGKDGLAGGLIFLSCLTLVFVYLERELFEASFLCVILSGSILGFLFFNFPPAKIILGDTGSLPLGLLMALVTMLPLSQGYTDEIYYLIPVVTLLVPITDTTWSFFRRIAKGVSPFTGDAEHFHHRLERLGLSPSQTIFVLFGIALYFDLWSLLPVYQINLIPRFVPLFFLFVLAHVAVLVFWLRHREQESTR